MDVSPFRFAIIIIALVGLTTTPDRAQTAVEARPNVRSDPRDTIARSRYSERIDILSAGAEYVASGGGGGFFDEYQKLGGAESALGTYLAPFVMGRLAMSDQLRLTAYTSLHSTSMGELYDVRATSDPRSPAIAGVREDLSILAVPILGGVEYAPIRTQFTSYVGIGGGFALARTKWQSSVEYTSAGYARPRSNTDGFGIAPAMRAYAGVDLRFDAGSVGRAAFRGIFLEASYLWLPVTRDYFGEIRARGASLPQAPSRDDATLYLGGLSFTFGLNLQVLRR
jgi:hypothetical protein